jgi:hypothetical protein
VVADKLFGGSSDDWQGHRDVTDRRLSTAQTQFSTLFPTATSSKQGPSVSLQPSTTTYSLLTS